MTRMDSIQIGKTFGCMSQSLHSLPVERYCNAASAVPEHHFDNHQYCGLWCQRKNATLQEWSTSDNYYRCKQTSKALFKTLQEKLSCFIKMERPIETAHGMDTNINESFNNTALGLHQRSRCTVFSSISLHTCLSLAVGTSSPGLELCFKQLFKKLGIVVTNNLSCFLQVKHGKCMKRLTKIQRKEHKRAHNKHKFELLKEHTIIAK